MALARSPNLSSKGCNPCSGLPKFPSGEFWGDRMGSKSDAFEGEGELTGLGVVGLKGLRSADPSGFVGIS